MLVTMTNIPTEKIKMTWIFFAEKIILEWITQMGNVNSAKSTMRAIA